METNTTTPNTTNDTLMDNTNQGKPSFRPLYVVIGLLSFAFILVAGVAISQRQQLLRGPVAPTAPESQPAAAEGDLTSCDLVFTVE